MAERPDVHSFLVRPFVDDAIEHAGSAKVESILAELGTDLDTLESKDSWISLELAGDLIARLEQELDDPSALERCGRKALSPRYLGVLLPLFRAFGSPMFAFSQVEASTARFNNVGRYRLLEKGRSSVRLAYEPVASAPAEAPIVCRVRAVNLAAIPTMFDLPPANVEEEECIHTGGSRCVYDLRWKAPRPRVRSRLGLLAGAAIGGAAALSLGGGVLATLLATAVGAWIGWSIGRVTELRGEVRDRAVDVTEQQDALRESVRMNERRYAELLEAKREVEARVEKRTAQLREARDRLTSALEEVQSASQAKEDFFANVSHELRTPLTLILAPLEDLAVGREPPGGSERALSAMHRNASRLLALINQLLDLAKIDAGAVKLTRTPTDTSALAHEVTERFSVAAEQRGIRLSFETEGAGGAQMLDSTWIESALTNLVANALRYASTTVTVRVSSSDDGSLIEVRDDGPGMTAEDVAVIFDRFAQGSTAEKRGGTGLGLAIVREAARLHGGEATVESARGEGAVFRITLPRAPATLPLSQPPRAAGAAEPTTPAIAGARPATPEAEPAPPPGAPLALVVEDNEDLRLFIASVLGTRYRVRTAADGEEALALVAELHPHVVVSDISMPRMDGLELTRAVRARDDTRTIPIVLVTARRSVANVLEGFEAGADDYVEKPFHGRELLARVDVHVRLREMVREMAHRERLATLGVVAASVAHQVRNPLTVLMSGLPSMQRRLQDKVDPSTREMLDVMHGCASRIERMTIDLLDLSRIDREEQGLFRPGEGLASATRLVVAGTPSGVEIDRDIDETAQLLGRAGDMNHVFLNLVDNAARAVGASGTIRVRGEVEDGAFVVRVADSGPGIPDEVRNRVFDPFFTTRAAGEGTGLGLSIAKQIVDQQGGSIEVGRDPDLGGAAFTVRLPGVVAGDGVVAYGSRSFSASDRR